MKKNILNNFPFVPQRDKMDCGIACIAMICKYYGKYFTHLYIEKLSSLTKEGVSMLNISDTFTKLGIDNVVVESSYKDFICNHIFPCVLYWNQNHFVVLYKIKEKKQKKIFHIADPAHGLIRLNEDEFKKLWIKNNIGYVLYTEPTEEFYAIKDNDKNIKFIDIFKYIIPFKSEILKIFVIFLIGSLFTITLPILTKKMVDKGIYLKDINFIVLILLSQLFILIGQSVIEIVRSRITLYIGGNININIISDFLQKLMSMPLYFFDSKKTGDILQRVYDHKKIENFLTSHSVLTIFSLLNFFIFFIILAYYSWTILFYYILITILSIFWVVYFQHKRKIIDYQRFNVNSENQEKILDLINGMQEIKLNNFENYQKNNWKKTQESLFKINLKILNIDQLQLSGYELINNIKNIIITFIVARDVVVNEMTLGTMLSISYILGEINSPIGHLVHFFRSLQDAELSFTRINEINNKSSLIENENLHNNTVYSDININKLYFKYNINDTEYVLKNISIIIPKNKTTAIVGVSGSGKTTLMKLLLKFYESDEGGIYLNNLNLNKYSFKSWITNCGIVMQDGYIFSDTIERNIATGDEIIDYDRLNQSIEIANIKSFINELPLGLKTKIGTSGNGISGGQKQRILIARAVYKSPKYMFFDEATSALDAENEKIIYNNLQSFFKGRTVVIIAHRLSTVKSADNIVVLKKGEVVEQGTHKELVKKKGEYYNLVKNQLELGT